MGEFENLIPEFVEESLDHLKNIEEDIIQIEQGQANDELINSVFRAVHSIKGGSSFLGLKNIEHLSHKMEDIFNLVRNGNLNFTSSISTKVLNAIDQLKEMLEDSGESDNFDISVNIRDMESVISQNDEVSVTDKISLIGLDTEIEISKYNFESYKKKGQKVYLLRVEFSEGQDYSNIFDFFKEMNKIGEIMESVVDIEFVMSSRNFSGDGIPLKIIYASVLEPDLVSHTFQITEEDIAELEYKDLEQHKTEKKVERKPEPVVEKVPEPVTEIAPEPVSQVQPPAEIYEEEEEEEVDIEAISDENEFMTFLIDEEEYGIGIKLIQEIVTMQPITEIPDSQDYTKGIINLRGDILPIYDFRLKLNFEEREYDGETIILILSVKEKKLGIIVDRISEVIQLNHDEIKDAPNMKNIPANYVLGIGQKNDKFIILLKVQEMIGEDENE